MATKNCEIVLYFHGIVERSELLPVSASSHVLQWIVRLCVCTC